MSRDELAEIFKKHDDEFLKFERIEAADLRSKRPDLCAFLLLDALLPGTSDMVASAAHDEIWLAPDVDDLANVITEAQIVTLVRCGVRLDDEVDSLAMFA